MLLSENKSFTPPKVLSGLFPSTVAADIGIFVDAEIVVVIHHRYCFFFFSSVVVLVVVCSRSRREKFRHSSERIEFIGNASFLEEEEAV